MLWFYHDVFLNQRVKVTVREPEGGGRQRRNLNKFTSVNIASHNITKKSFRKIACRFARYRVSQVKRCKVRKSTKFDTDYV